jgi:hypothetical protein
VAASLGRRRRCDRCESYPLAMKSSSSVASNATGVGYQPVGLCRRLRRLDPRPPR